MKVTFFLALLFLPIFASAATYNLAMEIYDGEEFFTPELQVTEGVTETFIQESDGKKTFVDVKATKLNDQDAQLRLEFAIGTFSENGSKIVTSSPSIVTMENHEASITAGQQGKNPDFSLLVSFSQIAE